MKLLEPITEHEMVALFLQTEIQSRRYRDTLLALLARDGKDSRIVASPNLKDSNA